jgi:diguanylate cyclase (GGDEF)-like protein/PAS domain S-box-containing protein
MRAEFDHPEIHNSPEFVAQVLTLFDHLNDAIFIVDPSGKIRNLNRSACKLTGFDKSEMLNQSIGLFILGHPDPKSHNREEIKSSPNHGSKDIFSQFKKIHSDFLTKSGRHVPIEITHIHMPKDKGNVSYVIARDISERIIAETLRETSRTLTSSLNLNEVFDLLLVELHKLIPFDGGNVMLVNRNMVTIARSVGYESFGVGISDQVLSLQFDITSALNLKEIVEKKKPVILPDTSKVGYWTRNDASNNFRSYIGVPVIINDQVEAIFSLDKIEKGFFNEDHIPIVTIFSNQAASAIKNARLFEAEEKRIQQLDGLQATLSSLTSKLDITSLLQEIVARAIKLLNASSGELALYQPDTNQLSILVSQDTERYHVGQQLEMGSGLLGKVAKTRKSLIAQFSVEENDSKETKNSAIVHPGMVVPLILADELLGVLGIADTHSNRDFSMYDIELLNTFAQQATVAIKNARLYEDAKHRAEEAETLRRAAAVVTSSLDQAEAISLILEQLAQVVPYDSAAVLFGKPDHLEIVGGRGFLDPESVLGWELPLINQNPGAVVYLTRQPIKVDNILDDYPTFNERTKTDLFIKSWLGVPLIVQGRCIGVLSLDSHELKHFNQDHMRLVSAFADQVAIALENARLYTDTSRAANAFETIYRISQIISSNIRAVDIYPAIHQAVSELMPTEFFCISLFDRDAEMIHDVYMVDREKPLDLTSRPIDKGLFSKVYREGKSLLFNTFSDAMISQHGAVLVGDFDEKDISQSILIVPLKAASGTIGVLSTQSYLPNIYTEMHRDILELLAVNVAIALENARLFDEVQQLAITDPVTHLFNRRKFDELAIKEFDRSRRYGRSLCAIMIDLDHFKLVNDTYGHLIGDQVLVQLASCYKQNVRNIDVLARFGGEEFVIILPETAAAEAFAMAERLRYETDQLKIKTKKGIIQVTISLGVVEQDESCKNLTELISRADRAMYASKHAGRNKSTLWSADLRSTTPTGPHNRNK